MRIFVSVFLIVFLLSSCNTSNKKAMDKMDKESSIDHIQKQIEEGRKREEELKKGIKDPNDLTPEQKERLKKLDEIKKVNEEQQKKLDQLKDQRKKEQEDKLRREDEAKRQELEEQIKAREDWEKSEAGQASLRKSLIEQVKQVFRRLYEDKRFDIEMRAGDSGELKALNAQEVRDQQDLQERIDRIVRSPNWQADLQKLGSDIPRIYG